MIKKEEQQVQDSNYVCLNPYCTDSLNRNFRSDNRHYNSSQCRKWIVQKEQLVSQNWQPYSLKSLDDLTLDFDNNPIQAAKRLQKLSISDWKKWLSAEQSRMKKQVCNSIEIEFQMIKIKIEDLITKSSFVNDLKQLASKVIEPTDLINQYYKNTSIEFQSMQNNILFKKASLKERLNSIKSQIQKIYSQMMEQKSQINKLLTYQQQRQYHQYIFQKTDNYFNKLQILAASLNAKMSAYTIQNQKISLECLICNKRMHSKIDPLNKKNAKKYLAQQILIHLYCQHYQQVGFAYTRKITKANIVPVTFQLFLQESKYFKTIKLIDRQSGPAFEQSYNFYKNNPDTYIVQILSIKNIHMTKGKHLLVSVHESIDMMIAIISYICTQRGQNVEVESKKQLLKNGLTQILDLKVEQKKAKKMKKEGQM